MKRFLLALAVVVPLTLSGCALMDWFVGVDEEPVILVPDDPTTPEDETVYAQPKKRSPLDALLALGSSLGPQGAGAAAVVGLMAENYRRKRKKKKLEAE